MAIIEVSNGRIERGGRLLVDEVALTINAGTSHAILGSNGSGKSTLLLALLGARFLTAGELAYEGRRHSTHKNPARLRAFVGQTHEAHDDLRVSEAVDLYVGRPMSNADLPLGVGALTSTPLGALSAGQRARVFLAAALTCSPQVLLLDEPTAFLDSATRVELLEALDEKRKAGTAIVMVSHDVDSILPGSHVHIIDDARLMPSTL